MLLIFLTSFCAITIPNCQSFNGPVHRRFEYKHSFRAPDLALRDGTIPFWTVIGDAIASEEKLRLAPSLRSRKGLAWNKKVMAESENFEIDMAFKVSGQGRVGADGIALWYTAHQPMIGSVFGANDYWTGMGIFMDSFDNDDQKNNPYIALMINDGTRSYDHQTDGSQQMLSGCQKDFRNKPFPMHIKVEYLKNVLTVSLSDEIQPTRYELCIRAENIFLPRNGYFAVSAATGGLADDHDIVSFNVFSLFIGRTAPEGTIPLEEIQKYEEEFEKHRQTYEKERQKFKEEHPDQAKPDSIEEEIAKQFEDTTQRELRMIYEMQATVHQTLLNIEQKLADVSQQQTTHSALIGQCAAAARGGGVGGAVAGGAPGDGFLQHEKNEALQSLRDLTASVKDMKSYVNEIFTRTYNLEQKFGGGAPPNVGGSSSSQTGLDTGIRSMIENIKNDVQQIRTTQLNPGAAAAGDCATGNCLSSTFFMLVILVQSVAIIGMLIMRSKPDKAKFY